MKINENEQLVHQELFQNTFWSAKKIIRFLSYRRFYQLVGLLLFDKKRKIRKLNCHYLVCPAECAVYNAVVLYGGTRPRLHQY